MTHYRPPLEGRSQKDYLLLDFNERTTPASPKVKEALKEFLEKDRLQVYPEYGDLEAKISEYAGVKPGQAMVTNGGDQGIDIIARAYLDEGDKAIIPFPSFAMHYQSVRIQGAEILEPRYQEPGILPLADVLNLLDDEKVKLVILCNPNNPTGIAVKTDEVEQILQKAKEKDAAVLHDEAYFEFSGLTAKDLIDKYDNLYIIRTFAKAFGIVGTRAGYVLSQEKNIQELLKIRGPYDVNMFAKEAILAALADRKYMEDYIKEVMTVSKPKLEEFLKQKGIKFLPSQANYLLLKIENPEALIEKLKLQGVLVRPNRWLDASPAVRISIGTAKDAQKLISALEKGLTQ